MSVTDLESAAGELAAAGGMPLPGTWKNALYRADAPGAELDSQLWARSWPEFMRAVTSEEDSSARQVIANVMARPRNAAFSERKPSEGGFLVPEYLRSQVMAYIAPAIVRPQAMVLPMGSLRLGVPALENSSQANGAGVLGGLTFAFTEEGAAITPSAPEFERAALEARKLAGYLQGVPAELVDDAAGPLGDFMARVIAMGVSWTEDDYFIGGSGVGEPQGLISAPCQVTVARAGSDAVVLADIVAMLKALHPAAKQAGLMAGVSGVGWLLSSTVLDQLLELYLTVGTTPTSAAVALSDWLTFGDGNLTGPSILGIPAVITDHQPALGTTGDVVLADLRNYLIGDRMEMTVEQSAAGAGFAADASNFRIRTRLDGRYWIQSPTTTEAGQAVSPVVVLGPMT